MELYNSIDHKSRKIISVLYRLILFGYATILHLTVESVYSWWVYLVAGLVFLLLSFRLINKEGGFRYVRLVIDHLYIFLILYQKDILILSNGFLLLIPILNYINHSSKNEVNRPPVILFVTSIVTFCLLRETIDLRSIVLPIIAVSLVNTLYVFRQYSHKVVGGVYNSIDELYQKPDTKPFVILRHFKNKMKFYSPKEITCFLRKSKEEFNIVAGTRRIVDYQLLEKDLFIKLLDNDEPFVYNSVVINQNEPEAGKVDIVVKSVMLDKEYIYIFENVPSWSFLVKGYFTSVVSPSLLKVSQTLNIDYELRKFRREMLSKVKKSYHYIDNSVKAVHFLNNKINPVNNYFWMLSQLDSLKGDRKKEFQKLITKERPIAEGRLKMIIDRTNSILDKAYNPIIANNQVQETLYYILYMVRASWYENELDHDLIRVNWGETESNNIAITIDWDIFSFILEEIIDNLKKHKKDNCTVTFDFIDGQPLIIFVNDIQPKYEEGIKKLTEDFNKPGINEIMKRDSHGTTLIKNGLDQLNIGARMTFENNLLKLTLRLNPEK